jgi:hypothetical protein
MRANVTQGFLAYNEGSAITSVEAAARDQVLEEAERIAARPKYKFSYARLRNLHLQNRYVTRHVTCY